MNRNLIVVDMHRTYGVIQDDVDNIIARTCDKILEGWDNIVVLEFDNPTISEIQRITKNALYVNKETVDGGNVLHKALIDNKISGWLYFAGVELSCCVGETAITMEKLGWDVKITGATTDPEYLVDRTRPFIRDQQRLFDEDFIQFYSNKEETADLICLDN